VAGQNHYAADVEDIVSSHAGIRARNAVALADDDRYLVVAEAARGVQLPDVAHCLRAALIEQLGVGPSSVRFVAPGSLPKTPSGKLQRHRVQALLTAGALAGVTEFDFRSRT
jgi:fatty-acyl-CoA synthase